MSKERPRSESEDMEERIRTVLGRDNPLTISEYLALREDMPADEIDIWNENQNAWMSWWPATFDEPFGISQMEMVDWLDCDNESVSSVSLKLLSALNMREKAGGHGATHLAAKGYIEDSFIAVLIAKQLEMMDWHGVYTINKDFMFLLRVFLKADDSKYLSSLHSFELKENARYWALCLKLCDKQVTIRNIAKLVGVQPSSVSRWFPDGIAEIFTNNHLDPDIRDRVPLPLEIQKTAIEQIGDLKTLSIHIDAVLSGDFVVKKRRK